MFCKNCGNKNGFLTVITDYKPLEMWEFNQGALTRYCQKDSGDMEVTVQCASCGSTDVDQEGFDIMMYSENPLVILSDEEWDKKLSEYKKEQMNIFQVKANGKDKSYKLDNPNSHVLFTL